MANWNANQGYYGQGPGGGHDARRARNRDPLGFDNTFQVPFQGPAATTPAAGVSTPTPTAPRGGGFVQWANSLGLSGNNANSRVPFPNGPVFRGGAGGGVGPGGPGGGTGGPGGPGGVGPGLGFNRPQLGGAGGVTMPPGSGGPPVGFNAASVPPGPTTDTSGWIFDPNSPYGSTTYNPGDWITTPIGGKQFQDDPSAAWQYWTASHGIDPMSNRGDVARSLSGRMSDAYDTAVLDNPLLSRLDFLRGIDPNMLLNNMSASQRGEQPSRYSGRGRTIARGYGGG